MQDSKEKQTGIIIALSVFLVALLGPTNPHHLTSTFSLEKHPAAVETPSGLDLRVHSGLKLHKAEITATEFDKFLKLKSYKLELDDGQRQHKLQGTFVHGPGHHSSVMAVLLLDPEQKPLFVLKKGDTRLSRADRNEPYVQLGFVGGRWDKGAVESSKIALAELSEEIGGEAVPETFRPLGDALLPSMVFESTECDAGFLSLVKITGAPSGDGGGMEAVELIGPKVVTPTEIFALVNDSDVADAARVLALHQRALDSIGYLEKLGVYVHDNRELSARFDTLGMKEAVDIRAEQVGGHSTETTEAESEDSSAVINSVVDVSRAETAFGSKLKMVDAVTRHAKRSDDGVEPVGEEFPNQYLHTDYDRAKLGFYFIDEKLGPMVKMPMVIRPTLAFAPGLPAIFRRDLEDLEVSRLGWQKDRPIGSRVLGRPGSASAGQSNLFYHHWVKEITVPDDKSDFVTLAEAIRLCRTGHGDSQTEALLVKLADDLAWIPQLGMSEAEARKLSEEEA